MKIGSIIENKRIKNRYSGSNLFGIVINLSKKERTVRVVELISGLEYIWISKECKVIYN